MYGSSNYIHGSSCYILSYESKKKKVKAQQSTLVPATAKAAQISWKLTIIKFNKGSPSSSLIFLNDPDIDAHGPHQDKNTSTTIHQRYM